MNLFVVAVGRKTLVDAARLEAALRRAAVWIPALETEPIHVSISRSGLVGVASVCHGVAAGSRRYRFEADDEIVLWDGMPVMTDGGFFGGAKALAQRLALTTEGIEGMFAVVRLDLVADTAEVHTDPLGNLAVYEMSTDDGTHYVSNSLATMAALQGGGEIDLLGASTFLTLGWYANGHSALAGVRLVGGGTRLSLAPGRLAVKRVYFGPGLVAGRSVDGPDLTTVRDQLIGQLRSAASYGSPLRLGLTAGQDSRVCLALVLAAEVEVELYTEGAVGDADVDAARAVARNAGLAHEVVPRSRGPSVDIATVVREFVGLGDATASFAQFHDQFAQGDAGQPLSIKLLGLGGEVARANTHPIRGFLVSGPPLADLGTVQLRCLTQKISLAGGLVRSSARDIVVGALNGWFDDRRAEGWRTRTLAETFYVFDAMIRQHQGSQRRTAGTSDVLAPLSSRAFITHALSLPPRTRYEPGIHQALITLSTPSLLDVPTTPPFARTRPALAPLASTKALAGLAWSRRRGNAVGKAPAISERSWTDQSRTHLEMVESASRSQLFSLIDRDVLIETLRGTRPVTAGTLRALTLVWWLETIARVPSPTSARL